MALVGRTRELVSDEHPRTLEDLRRAIRLAQIRCEYDLEEGKARSDKLFAMTTTGPVASEDSPTAAGERTFTFEEARQLFAMQQGDSGGGAG